MLSPEEFYKASNLTTNPFRSNPSTISDPRADIWVGYEKEQRVLVKFANRTRSDQVGNTNFVVLHGDYGTGKSHALLWLQNRILVADKDDFNAACYFIPTLKKAKGALTFAGAFSEDLLAKSTLVADVQDFRTFLGSCLFRYRDQESISSQVKDIELIERIIPAVELYNFAKALFRVESEAEVKTLLAPRGLTDYQAIITFTRLVNLFTLEIPLKDGVRRFKKAVYLLLDELDDLLRAQPKEAREVNDALRHLYDSCPNCFGLIIALSAEAAELPAAFEKYILTRVQRFVVFQVLDKSDAVQFVREVLDANRIDDAASIGFFPFDEGAIDAIAAQLTEITPRLVVNTMQQVIEDVRLGGFDPTTGLVTLEVLDQLDILDEIIQQGRTS
jgi:hypothetical protein